MEGMYHHLACLIVCLFARNIVSGCDVIHQDPNYMSTETQSELGKHFHSYHHYAREK